MFLFAKYNHHLTRTFLKGIPQVCFKGYQQNPGVFPTQSFTFNNSFGKKLCKHCWERRKPSELSFSPFPTKLSSLLQTSFIIPPSPIFYLLSADTFNLKQSKFLLYGKELKMLIFNDSLHLITP